MKSTIYYMILFSMLPFYSLGQNLGIGTNNPQATLDLRGNYRLGGQSKFLSYDSLSGKIGWSNSFLYVPVDAQLIQHSASAEGLYYANSSLQYLNQFGNPVFSTNWNNGNGYFSDKLGIGTANPLVKLHVQNGISGASRYSIRSLVSESSTNNYFSFYTPDNFQSAILFEKQGQVQNAGIFYNNPAAPDGMQVYVKPCWVIFVAPRTIVQPSGVFSVSVAGVVFTPACKATLEYHSSLNSFEGSLDPVRLGYR